MFLWAVNLLQSSLLLLVVGFTTVGCIPAVDGMNSCCCWRPFTLVPHVLPVAGLPSIVALLFQLAFLLLLLSLPAVDGVLALAGVLAIASILDDPGVSILAGVFTHCTVQCTLYNGAIGLSDYRIQDQGLNLSGYRILDSQKTLGCPPLFILLKFNISVQKYGVFHADS